MNNIANTIEIEQLDEDEEVWTNLMMIVKNKMSRWANLRHLLIFSPRMKSYNVKFKRREEIFDLVECNIKILTGSSHIWQGSALGKNSTRAFELAFLKTTIQKPEQKIGV